MPVILQRMLLALTAFAALAFPAGCASAQSNDRDGPPRIIAIGDIHGDFDAYLSIIVAAGVGDKRGRWLGDETILVQTGDIPDRGPDTREIIEHLRKLEKNAARKGGRVVALIGNHEAMNMTGDLRYVDPGEYAAFADRNSDRRRAATFDANREVLEAYYLERDPTLTSDAIREAWYAETPLGKLEHQSAWRADGEIGEWVLSHDAVIKIGETIFVHGGLSAEYATLSLAEINTRVRTALASRDLEATSIINDPLGPLWYRGLVKRDPPAPETEDNAVAQAPAQTDEPTPLRPSIAEELNIVLDAYEAGRIVVGHTPILEGVTASQDGRIIQIDTGMSAYYGGVVGYLEIVDGEAIAHNATTGETRVLPATSAGDGIK